MTRREVPFPFLPVPSPSWLPDGRPVLGAEALVLAAFVAAWTNPEDGAKTGDVLRLGAPALAGRTGLSVRAVEQARRELVTRGLLVVMDPGGRGRGSVASYRLGAAILRRKPAIVTPKEVRAFDAKARTESPPVGCADLERDQGERRRARPPARSRALEVDRAELWADVITERRPA